MTPTSPNLADNNTELLEVVHDDGCLRAVGRGVVHRSGLLHKAVHCFVTDNQGRLLLQQRSCRKSIGAGLWDVSVAEHVLPGESFQNAAIRGLAEELGISCEQASAIQPVTEPFRRQFKGEGFDDNEIVQGFLLTKYSGPVTPCKAEIEAVRWKGIAEVVKETDNCPEIFTPWFIEHLILALDSIKEKILS